MVCWIHVVDMIGYHCKTKRKRINEGALEYIKMYLAVLWICEKVLMLIYEMTFVFYKSRQVSTRATLKKFT